MMASTHNTCSSANTSNEIQIHFESGEQYRPFTSVKRINAIDAKKKSSTNPLLFNITKSVPESCVSVFDSKTMSGNQGTSEITTSTGQQNEELGTQETLASFNQAVTTVDSMHTVEGPRLTIENPIDEYTSSITDFYENTLAFPCISPPALHFLLSSGQTSPIDTLDMYSSKQMTEGHSSTIVNDHLLTSQGGMCDTSFDESSLSYLSGSLSNHGIEYSIISPISAQSDDSFLTDYSSPIDPFSTTGFDEIVDCRSVFESAVSPASWGLDEGTSIQEFNIMDSRPWVCSGELNHVSPHLQMGDDVIFRL